jgi:hypothetical protein
MQLSKNKFKGRTNIPVLLSIIIVIVVILELAGVYFFWYRSLDVKVTEPGSENIVRVDLPGYRNVIQFLDSLVAFEPSDEAEELGSPFLYR